MQAQAGGNYPDFFVFTFAAFIMKEQIPVSGSIVLYNNKSDIEKAIHSFLQVPLPVRLYLVDNSPTDALKTALDQFLADDRVEYIFNNENMGYGAGHNVALRRSVASNYPFHFVMNPDVEFDPNTIPAICGYMLANQNVGLVMPKIMYPDGQTQHLCKLLPTPFDLFIRRFLPDSLTEERTNRFELRETGYDKIMEVPFLSGCFMSLRKETIEQCGMFDERFFMYGEDIDFSRRIQEKFKTIFYPQVSIVHGYEAASYKNIKMLLIHSANIIKYFNKWGWFWDKKRKKINEKTLEKIHSQSV